MSKESEITTDRHRMNRRQARYFDGAVDLFDQEQPPHILQRLERVVSEAEIQEGETVLDVGAGVGVLVPMIRAHGAGLIIACELSEKMLVRLKQNYPEVRVILGDVCDLGLQEGSVDVVFMNAVYPNIADKAEALRNCSRMLKVGGRLLISHPEGREFVDRLREIVPFPLDPLPTAPQVQELIATDPLKLVKFVDQEDLYLTVILRE